MTEHRIEDKQECPFEALERHQKELSNAGEFWNTFQKYKEALWACKQFICESDPYHIGEYGSFNISAFYESG